MQTLFLTDGNNEKQDYKRIIMRTAEAVCDAFDCSSAYSGLEPAELKNSLHMDTILPENGIGQDRMLEIVKEKILPNMLRPSSVDYMPHLHGPALIESLSSEVIISAFNQSMDSWDQSPAATEIEVEVVRHLCSLYGFGKDGDGVFTSGGSQSNQTAMILARDWFCSNILGYDVKKFGLPADFKKLRMYTSEISHFSMEKSAHILGLGYEAVVKVPVDSKKRMDTGILKQLVERDISDGNIPFLVVGTAGTTDFGSIDSLRDIHEICSVHNMWLHADAAYGSGVVMSRKYRQRVAGLELCDSITVDFHKMFLLPISCSAVLVKDGADFAALTIHADYLNREEDEEDGYTNLVDKSIQTTRRFDALKVWMSFLCRGKNGWSEIITKSIDNAAYFYSVLKENKNFAVITEPEISSVVFRFSGAGSDLRDDAINKKVRRILIHKHGIIVGQTVSEKRVCLKFTLLNPLVTKEKLEDLVKIIQEEAFRIISESTSVVRH